MRENDGQLIFVQENDPLFQAAQQLRGGPRFVGRSRGGYRGANGELVRRGVVFGHGQPGEVALNNQEALPGREHKNDEGTDSE